MKKIIALILMVCMVLNAGSVLAAPRADIKFDSASISLTASRLAVYSANLNEQAGSVRVVSASLYYKTGNTWQYLRSLPVPSAVFTNAYTYGASISYASYFGGSGTYRITATFDADGYQVTRSSNERTF